MKDSHIRSFVKGMSWRIVGTIDTIVISFFVTGTFSKALGFADLHALFVPLALSGPVLLVLSMLLLRKQER